VTSYPNPALRSVALRTVGPFIPVWLFGIVFGLLLDRLGPTGTLDPVEVLAFSAFYTLLSGALVAALFLRQYQSTPEAVEIDVGGIAAPSHGRSVGAARGAGAISIPYERISSLVGGGLMGWRIEGRRSDTGRLDWINLTEENAGRVADALDAWRRREAPEEPVPAPSAVTA
jgi:hypothetical protein